mmetsp:Transcript_26206/g.25370  ORF Transcript_26206/g.25370 Transcript_26206/m.25370 type:complete len:195 (-) Transcript_26206:504-1088(-)
MKRSLRPRKIENYRKMVEGDEITLKTIIEERNEMRQRLGLENDLDLESAMLYEDDEDDMKDQVKGLYAESDSMEEVSKKKQAKKKSKVCGKRLRRKSSIGNDDDLIDIAKFSQVKKGQNLEKYGQSLQIDILPNDEKELRAMLREVKKSIKMLEKQFFEEENSDNEEEMKKMSNPNHVLNEDKLVALKQHSHIQ